MVTTRIHPVPLHGPADGARTRPLFGLRGREQWEQANRRGLLMVHGFVGTFAGLLILFNGTAKVLDDHGSFYRPLTGGLALAGGALLLAGLTLHRAMRLEVAGLVLLALWDLAMTAGFVVTAFAAAEVSITWPWQAVSGVSSVRLYPIALYVGLFVMMCVHLVTLRQIRRVDARRVTIAKPAVAA